MPVLSGTRPGLGPPPRRSSARWQPPGKTEAIDQRYAVVSETDLREGAEKLARAEEGKVLGKVDAGSDFARA